MIKFKVFGWSALAIALLCFVPSASAQISVGVGIGGPAPICPYGYFDYRSV